MRRSATSLVACAAGGLVAMLVLHCGSSGDAPDDDVPLPARSDAGPDAAKDALAPTDASSAACDPKKPFGTPVRLAEFDALSRRSTPRLSADELTIYFTTIGDGSAADLSTASRASKSAPFGNERVLPQSTVSSDNDPSVGADHLTLWFHSGRNGTADIFLATRATTDASFGDASLVANVDQPTTNENQPYFRAAASELWFVSDRPKNDGGFDIYMATRSGATFGAPAIVPELSSLSNDFQPQPSEDGLTILFSSDRPGGTGKQDLWIARRANDKDKFGAPTPLTELNSPTVDQAGWLSADGCRIWFSSGRGTADAVQQLFFAQRPK